MERSVPLKVFVYGTLKPNEINFDLFCAGKVLKVLPVLAQGKLYQIPFYTEKYPRGYPAMTLEKGWVEGFLLQFKNEPEILQQLDQLESYEEGRSPAENEYQRQKIAIFSLHQKPLGKVWGYVMNLDHVQKLQGTPVNRKSW